MAKPKKKTRAGNPDYLCDVCGLRFQPGPVAGLPDDETWCPRCHTSLVYPVERLLNRGGKLLPPLRQSCG